MPAWACRSRSRGAARCRAMTARGNRTAPRVAVSSNSRHRRRTIGSCGMSVWNWETTSVKLTAEGATRDEALDRLRALLQQPRSGAELSVVEWSGPPAPNPWADIAGMYDPNDPVVQDWLETMAENCRKADG